VGGLVDVVKSPCYATAVGLVKYGAEQLHKSRVVAEEIAAEQPQRRSFGGRFGQWFREVF